MNSSHYKKSQFKLFCADIGSSPEKIELISKNIDSHYKEWTEKKIDKKNGGYKKYKDGTEKTRTIRPPSKELKKIQRKIKDRILSKIELPKQIHGGVKGRSNISNAKPHQGKKYQLTTDLQSFYPSVTHNMVYDTFLNFGYSNHYSHWITKLTTWKYQLPQGTPTSTHIANLVFLETDFRLIDFCNRNDLTYTRYIDDLTFSSSKCFRPLIDELLAIVIRNGFKISFRKTKYEGNQNITGIDVFNNYIDGPQRIIDKANQEELEKKDFKPYKIYLANIRKTNSRKPAANKELD